MQDHVRERAPAKVNLALHVLGRRDDGYHELDSLVAFVPQVADEVGVSPARTCALYVTGPYASAVPSDERNLALRAARALLRHWPAHFAPVRVDLHKNLPAAGGIGGGSADAAAVMRAMCRLAGFEPPPHELRELALRLGADVPVCLHGAAARMRGIGEQLTPLHLPSDVHVLLVNPGVQVSTAEVFARLHAGLPDATRALPAHMHAGHWGNARQLASALKDLRNDLEPPACMLAPRIATCLAWLRRQPGVLLARMSGSGATCLALFADAATAHDTHAAMRRQHPHWWGAAGKLG